MAERAVAVLVVALAALVPLALLGSGPVEAGASVPDGFRDEAVVDADSPIALAFLPDGGMLVTEKDGRLLVVRGGTARVALDISARVCANSERGLLGVAPHPDFAQNGSVYLYYTHKERGVCPTGQPQRADNPVNRVSRFTMAGDTVDPASETVLLDGIPSPNGNHNGGDLHFGKDGHLYVTVGDGACDYMQPTRCQPENDAARDPNVLLGKVLRVTADGGIPPDNPYTGPDSARCNETGMTDPGKRCRETYASGLRNPFRFAFDPDSPGTRFFVNDVGGANFEEVDEGVRGADYGWNCMEAQRVNSRSGKCDPRPPGLDYPVHSYAHSSGCSSITGGAFVPDGLWPGRDRSYLFGDYVCGKVFELTPKTGGGYAAREFATGLGRGGPVSMAFGQPEGGPSALYYTTFAGDRGGQVRRIVYEAQNRRPVARAATAGENYGAETTMSFDGSGSSDPDGDDLTYSWDFTSDGAYDAAVPSPTHDYGTRGRYEATLRVTDEAGASDTDTVTVFPGNTPPEPVISSPGASDRFAVGERIRLSGSATDAQDASAPALEWEVLRHHAAPNPHAHPYFDRAGGEAVFVAPAPEDLRSTDPAGNYLEVRLTATDSLGLEKTVTRRLEPRTAPVLLRTAPTGLRLVVNSETVRGPSTLVSWEGYVLNVSAPNQGHRGKRYAFVSWSDGGGRKHAVSTPQDGTTLTARFRRR